jgi:valyl-tRNA synthetase
MELSSKYTPVEIEQKWYQYWLDNKFFHSEPNEKEPYTIVIPPPNVTGVLHMGHMLNNTIQDVLVRRARMQGKNACWVPGTDHASIATEAKVVAKLASEGIKKTDLSREDFLKHAWDWTHKHGGIILEQLKKLGCSCDWDRTAFTMDEIRSKSVIKVFCDLYEKGLIYRGVRMVNWDPQALTALSDEEVNHKEQQGKLYYLKYKVVGENGEAVVATTRPETIMGDTAMCINPNNPKTAWLKGKKVIVPLINREIPVIEDEYVDMEFGTGCLKVTPAHDVNDYMLGEKYNLPSIDIFNDNGTLNENGAMYAGMDRFECRKKIEKDLEAAGLMEKIEPYTNKVGFSERTDVPIEPKLSTQWFLKMEDLAKPALEAVENDTIKFYPEKFKNTYRYWMTNIKDWCISRQLWWGHQIPAWYFNGKVFIAETKEEAYKKALAAFDFQFSIDDLKQDEDCLDTWFSSWLWPISVFDGINNPENKDIEYYYPTNDLITGPDIIFFWVARMIVSGYEYRGEECFKNVYFTGVVRDKLGRKMSKQLGNSPDPLDLIAKYGADGVRMGMLLTSPAGNDLPFDESLCEQGRNFNNKIWNAFRLIEGWEISDDKTKFDTNSLAIWWFDVKLQKAIAETDDLFSKYRLSEALMVFYKLFWDDFCAWYLEAIKPEYGKPIDRQTYSHTIYFLLEMLKRLHPFMPFITEELYQVLREKFKNYNNIPDFTDTAVVALQNFVKEESITIAHIENSKDFIENSENYSEEVISDFEKVKEIIANIRNIRQQKNISPKEKLNLQISGEHNAKYDEVIKKLANIESLEAVKDKSADVVSFLVGTTEYAIPLGNLIDAEEEIGKMETEIKYLEGFLKSVNAKLSNERFVANAKPEIVENERKKQADAESKMVALKESIARLK